MTFGRHFQLILASFGGLEASFGSNFGVILGSWCILGRQKGPWSKKVKFPTAFERHWATKNSSRIRTFSILLVLFECVFCGLGFVSIFDRFRDLPGPKNHAFSLEGMLKSRFCKNIKS